MLKTTVLASLSLFFLWYSSMLLTRPVRADDDILIRTWLNQWQLISERITIPKPQTGTAFLRLSKSARWINRARTHVQVRNHCHAGICKIILLETDFSDDSLQSEMQSEAYLASEVPFIPLRVIIPLALEGGLSLPGSSIPRYKISTTRVSDAPLNFTNEDNRDRNPLADLEMPGHLKRSAFVKPQPRTRTLPFQPVIIQKPDDIEEVVRGVATQNSPSHSQGLPPGEASLGDTGKFCASATLRLLYVDRAGQINIAQITYTEDTRLEFIEVGNIQFVWLNDHDEIIRGQQYDEFWLSGLPTGHDHYLELLTVLVGTNGVLYSYANAEGETVYSYYDENGQLHTFTASELQRLLGLYHDAELERVYPEVFGVNLPPEGGVAPEKWMQDHPQVPFPILHKLTRLRIEATDKLGKTCDKGMGEGSSGASGEMLTSPSLEEREEHNAGNSEQIKCESQNIPENNEGLIVTIDLSQEAFGPRIKRGLEEGEKPKPKRKKRKSHKSDLATIGDGLEVKTSNLAFAGNGVFATRPFSKGEE